MESVIRAAATYLFLLVLFRLSGRRTLSQITTFDLVLVLIISEAIQEALIDSDRSVTNAFLLVTTLVTVDILLSFATHRWEGLRRVVDGLPIVAIKQGKLLQEPTDKERVTEDDILAAARELHGLERLDQIKYAVIEQGGSISIVPKKGAD